MLTGEDAHFEWQTVLTALGQLAQGDEVQRDLDTQQAECSFVTE